MVRHWQAVDRLHSEGYLDNTGLLLEDPRQTQWREVLSTLDVAKGDSLAPDQSPVAEVRFGTNSKASARRPYRRVDECGALSRSAGGLHSSFAISQTASASDDSLGCNVCSRALLRCMGALHQRCTAPST
jgi:hypothetical protein